MLDSTINRIDYLGTGSVSTFSFPFKIFDSADLKVSVSNGTVEFILQPLLDYTVTGVGSDAGGMVTLINPSFTPLVTGYTLTIRRVRALKQETDIRNQGEFFPETIENTFDQLVMNDQMLDEDLTRCLKLSESIAPGVFDATFPLGVVGAQAKLLITNLTGDGLDVGPALADISSAAAAGAAAASSASDAALSDTHAVNASVTAGRWANEVLTTVFDANTLLNLNEYSAKEYAVGVQTRGMGGKGSAKDWANYVGGSVDGFEFSSKEYATGIQTRGVAGKGSAKDWSNYTGSTVDGTGYSAKENAQGTQTRGQASGGSAKDWATFLGGTVDNTSYSSKENAQGTQTRGQASGGSAKDWANYIGGTVDNAEYSAKEHAQGIKTRGLSGGGSSKDWAVLTTTNVDGTEYSSKEYASGIQTRGQAGKGSAKDWANYVGGPVDGTEFSSKKYAADAKQSALDAALAATGTPDLTPVITPIVNASVATHAALTTTHGVTGSIVGTGGVQTLTNKTLTSPVVTTPTVSGQKVSDFVELGTTTLPSTPASGKQRVYFDGTNLMQVDSTGTSTNLGSGAGVDLPTVDAHIATHAALITTHGVTGTLVGTTDIQTLTNKTLTSAVVTTPTVSGQKVSDFMELGTTTLPSTPASGKRRVYFDGSSVMQVDSTGTSSSLGGTAGVDITTVDAHIATHAALTTTHGVTGSIVGTGGAQTLLTKTMTSPVLNTPTMTGAVVSDFVELGTSTVPSTPASGKRRVFFDGTQLNSLANSGIVTPLTGLTNNYITNPTAESNTSGWAQYHDATSYPPTLGTGTAGGSITAGFTVTTPSLRGAQSFLYTQGSAGEGVAFPFTIDACDRGRVLGISFDLSFSGTYPDGSLNVFIYDITNSQMITPSYPAIMNALTNTTFRTTFQPASNASQFRLLIHQASNSGSYTMKFDNVVVGPQAASIGMISTPWAAYAMTISASTPPTLGTTTVNSAQWRRVGDNVEIFYNLNQTVAGTTGSGTYLFALPPGVSAASSVLAPDINLQLAQVGNGYLRGGTNNGSVTVHLYDATHMALRLTSSIADAGTSNAIGGLVGNTNYPLNTAVTYSFSAKFPVAGWTSSQVLSSDSGDSRVIVAQVNQASPTATITSTLSLLKFSVAPTTDTLAGYSTSTGLYTVQVGGLYTAGAGCAVSATNSSSVTQAAIAKNGTTLQSNAQIGSTATMYPAVTCAPFSCVAGDTISPQVAATGTTPTVNANATLNYFWVQRLSSGAQQIAASEKIFLEVSTLTALSLGSASAADIVFNTVNSNSHGSYNPATGEFTAPRSDWYNFSYLLETANANVGTSGVILTYLAKKSIGGGYATYRGPTLQYGIGVTAQFSHRDSGGIYLNAGDAIKVQANCSTVAVTLSTSFTSRFTVASGGV